MIDRQEVRKAFWQSRVTGKELLDTGRINWTQYIATIQLYEELIKSLNPELYKDAVTQISKRC